MATEWSDVFVVCSSHDGRSSAPGTGARLLRLRHRQVRDDVRRSLVAAHTPQGLPHSSVYMRILDAADVFSPTQYIRKLIWKRKVVHGGRLAESNDNLPPGL